MFSAVGITVVGSDLAVPPPSRFTSVRVTLATSSWRLAEGTEGVAAALAILRPPAYIGRNDPSASSMMPPPQPPGRALTMTCGDIHHQQSQPGNAILMNTMTDTAAIVGLHPLDALVWRYASAQAAATVTDPRGEDDAVPPSTICDPYPGGGVPDDGAGAAVDVTWEYLVLCARTGEWHASYPSAIVPGLPPAIGGSHISPPQLLCGLGLQRGDVGDLNTIALLSDDTPITGAADAASITVLGTAMITLDMLPRPRQDALRMQPLPVSLPVDAFDEAWKTDLSTLVMAASLHPTSSAPPVHMASAAPTADGTASGTAAHDHDDVVASYLRDVHQHLIDDTEVATISASGRRTEVAAFASGLVEAAFATADASSSMCRLPPQQRPLAVQQLFPTDLARGNPKRPARSEAQQHAVPAVANHTTATRADGAIGPLEPAVFLALLRKRASAQAGPVAQLSSILAAATLTSTP